MPLLIAPFVAFALGALLGFGLGLPERARDLRFGRSVVGWFACIGFAPVPGYFAWSVPSWSVAYLINGDRLPSAVALAMVVASAGLVAVGFEVVQRAIAEGQPRRGLASGFAAALLAVASLTAVSGRLWLVGSYAEVTGGFSVPNLATTSTGLAAIGLDSLLGIALWVSFAALRAPRHRLAAKAAPTIVLRGAAQTPDRERGASAPLGAKSRSTGSRGRRR